MHKLPEWFDMAVQCGRAFEARTKGTSRATKSVYAVLLRDDEKDRWGVYIGMTGHTPEQRYWNHKKGHKASRWVQRFGVTLIPSLFSHLNPCESEEAQELEKLVLAKLREIDGLWVEGA